MLCAYMWNGLFCKYVLLEALIHDVCFIWFLVLVGNIPYDASEEQLIQICEEVGPVVSFRLVTDRETGRPKGYGCCEYKDEETALSAHRNLQGYEINGRQLRVDFAENDKNTDRNREKGHGGPGMVATVDAQKQIGGPAAHGDSGLYQPIGLSIAMAAATVMAGALGGAQIGSKSNQNALHNHPVLGTDPLTLYLATLPKNQLNEIMSEVKRKQEASSPAITCKPSVAKSCFPGTDNARNAYRTNGVFLHLIKCCVIFVLLSIHAMIDRRPMTFFKLQLKMPNVRQASGPLRQPLLQVDQQGHQPAVQTLPGLLPNVQSNMHFGLSQEGQLSSGFSNSLVHNQYTAVSQLPTQPQIPLPQVAQNPVLQQVPLPIQPSIHPQQFPNVSVGPQTQVVTSSSMKQQAQPPFLQHPGQIGSASLGHSTQLAGPSTATRPTRPPLPDHSFQPSSSKASVPNSMKKEFDGPRRVTSDPAWVRGVDTSQVFPSGSSEKASMLIDSPDLFNRPSKMARVDDGREESCWFVGPELFYTGGASCCCCSHQLFVECKSKLPSDVESAALLQQVLNLTPEQLSSLQPDQQLQVIQLQQMLREST
ncbi:hypothetical protein RJ639_009896 [Escallonia herrerae]|uniref:RRM domain-containing protein n=1 Tax=Escallonia herrerae TaxID=1293975 RepID=A0AA88VNV1_9ASTE|nr:hypothetical protein RJ639_009896 [Escallonia herrerae]